MTVKEIAKLAGTSRGTVDRVLNNRGNVSPEVKRRVMEIVEAENYQPNQLARALFNSRKHIKIGVAVSSIGNPFFDDVLMGIYHRGRLLKSYGLELLVKETKGYGAREQIDAVKELVAEGIDGLDIMPINLPEVKEYLSSLEIPIVTFNTDIDIPKLAFVGCDYYNSGRVSGDIARLILGKEGSVAVVIGSMNIAGHNGRLRGFIASVSESPGIRVVAQLENQDDDEVSYRVVRDFLEESSPDLIYFSAAGIEGGINAVLDSKKDVHIITVDDTDAVKKHLKSGVISATVTQQPFLQGDVSIKTLFDYLSEGKAPRDVNSYTANQVLVKHSKYHH